MVCGQAGFFSAPPLARHSRFALALRTPRFRLCLRKKSRLFCRLNGSVRVCGDFKVSVNPVLLTEQYPLPRIEDIFANLAAGKHFSKLDLRQAYHQMEVTEASKKLLAINTHKGLFRYNRLVFGISSCPAIWQRAIDQVLQGIPGVQCILDDMIV